MNGTKTQIIVAALTLIGVLGGALLANWDKLFPYQYNYSQGRCSGTVSSDGRRMTSICVDTACGQF